MKNKKIRIKDRLNVTGRDVLGDLLPITVGDQVSRENLVNDNRFLSRLCLKEISIYILYITESDPIKNNFTGFANMNISIYNASQLF